MGMLWHLWRVDSTPQIGPASLVCLEGETPIKFLLKNSVDNTFDSLTACVAVDATATEILTMLDDAGYTPNDFGLGEAPMEDTGNGISTRTNEAPERAGTGSDEAQKQSPPSAADLLERH